jgi:riboflavin kinase/FMN adenylyltransferase
MRLIRDFRDLPATLRAGVVAIGNFDGLHHGHDLVLRHLRDEADRRQAPAMVMSFEPSPRRFFTPDAPLLRILPLREKIRRLREDYRADVCLMQRFDAAFAGMTARAFIEQVLQDGLGVRHVITGEEFCFGRQRAGNVTMLEQWGRESGHFTTSALPLAGDGEKYSSSRIREALRGGDMALAEKLLGRAYYWKRRVVHGDKRGLGAPTANLLPPAVLKPRRGVYAVRAFTQDGAYYKGVANFGMQPSFGGTQERLEVHLFDFSGDLYGQELTVEWKAFLRDEQTFASTDALRAQIMRDVAAAKEVLYAQ